jgi:hypothetical protein
VTTETSTTPAVLLAHLGPSWPSLATPWPLGLAKTGFPQVSWPLARNSVFPQKSCACRALLAVSSFAQTTMEQWNFNSGPPRPKTAGERLGGRGHEQALFVFLRCRHCCVGPESLMLRRSCCATRLDSRQNTREIKKRIKKRKLQYQSLKMTGNGEIEGCNCQILMPAINQDCEPEVVVLFHDEQLRQPRPE